MQGLPVGGSLHGPKKRREDDIYNIGQVLYQTAHGISLTGNQNSDTAPKKIPHDIKQVIGKCILGLPGKQYQSVKEIYIDLKVIKKKYDDEDEYQTLIQEIEELEKKDRYQEAFSLIREIEGRNWNCVTKDLAEKSDRICKFLWIKTAFQKEDEYIRNRNYEEANALLERIYDRCSPAELPLKFLTRIDKFKEQIALLAREMQKQNETLDPFIKKILTNIALTLLFILTIYLGIHIYRRISTAQREDLKEENQKEERSSPQYRAKFIGGRSISLKVFLHKKFYTMPKNTDIQDGYQLFAFYGCTECHPRINGQEYVFSMSFLEEFGAKIPYFVPGTSLEDKIAIMARFEARKKIPFKHRKKIKKFLRTFLKKKK